MDAALAIYVTVSLAIVVAVVVSAVMLLLVRRVKTERVLYGFSGTKSFEAYIGYGLLATGVVLIMVCIGELAVLLTGPVSAAPFNIMNIPVAVGANSIEGDYVGLGLGVGFWLLMLWLAGRKLATLGLDLLKGKRVLVKFRRT